MYTIYPFINLRFIHALSHPIHRQIRRKCSKTMTWMCRPVPILMTMKIPTKLKFLVSYDFDIIIGNETVSVVVYFVLILVIQLEFLQKQKF